MTLVIRMLAAIFLATAIIHFGSSPGIVQAAEPAAFRTVTKTTDTNDGACNSDCSLREAIAAAASGDTIIFSSLFNTPQSIVLTGQLSITKSLTIAGTGARNLTVIRAGMSAAHRLFTIDGPAITVNLKDLTLTGGIAGAAAPGGGIYLIRGTLFLFTVTVKNSSAENGGGIYSESGSTLNIFRSTINNNIAFSGGGGIHCSGDLIISNSTITSNQAFGGGGVLRNAGVTTANNVTISHNTGTNDSGGFRNAPGAGPEMSFFRNTIIAQNTSSTGPDITGWSTSLGNNLIGNNSFSGGFSNGVNGDKVNVNPLLSELLNNGGPTDTRLTNGTGPAINAGNGCVTTATCATRNPYYFLTEDQRGYGFPRPEGATIDMGAVQVPRIPNITSLSPTHRGLNTGTFTLTVNGTNFVGTSTVRWNNENRLTTFVSSTQLRAEIPGTDLQTVREVAISVFTPAPALVSASASFNVVACTLMGPLGTFSFTPSGGGASVSVSGTIGCTWTATTTAPWITNLTPGAAGDGTVSFTVQANTGGPRSTTIRVSYPSTGFFRDINVTQTGCTFSLTASGVGIAAGGGGVTYNVVAPSGCTWTSSTSASFVTITAGATGSGNGAVSVTVAPNTGPARTATVVSAGQTFNISQSAGIARRSPFDFDGDGKTDLGIFRPSNGEWWVNRSSNGITFAAQFGSAADKISPADFTGDGKTDIAFWRPSTGSWFVLRSEDSSFYAVPFGIPGDIPSAADFDADGKADTTIFRPSTATWYIQRSSDNGTTIQTFGTNGDLPVVADYDGDGRADIAIYRPSAGQWWLLRSTAGVIAASFGTPGDKLVPGDYTGDGKTDVALWRPSTGQWFVLRSEDFSFYSVPFGLSTDVPAPGDYDGDGKYDTTVFRPSSATWYSQRSTAGTLIQTFGVSTDRPVPNAFVP